MDKCSQMTAGEGSWEQLDPTSPLVQSQPASGVVGGGAAPAPSLTGAPFGSMGSAVAASGPLLPPSGRHPEEPPPGPVALRGVSSGKRRWKQVGIWSIMALLILAAFGGGFLMADRAGETGGSDQGDAGDSDGVSKEQYDQLNAELDAANFELQSAQENLTKAQENLSKAQEDLTQIEDEYDTLLSEKNAKELELETKRLELEGLSDDKNVTDAELALKRAEYEQLWAELNGTSDNVTAKALELEQAREALNSTLDDMAGIVDERDHYWAQYNETLAQYNETKDRLVLIDDLGRTVTIPTTPRRIVSIASSVTETLYALDAGDLVVGRDTYSTYPPEVTDKPDVGSSFGLSVEMVVGLEPDMVFCWWYATSAMDSLENVGITTFAINPRSVEEVLQTIRMIGLITNHTVEAETLTGEMQQELDGITDITDGINKTGRPLVYYELSTPMKTTGPGTFTNELIFMAGGINLAADEPLRYPILSSEYIIGKDPDVIVIVSYGTSVDDVKARDGWSNITAVKDDRVYTIDTNWVTCNPRLILGLEQFAEWFHPDKFS